MELLTGAQIRMARGLLRWSVQHLADQAGISVSTVKKLEKNLGVAQDVLIQHHNAVRKALLETKIVRFEDNACICLVDDSDS